MNEIDYIHFSLDELLATGENADMALDGAFLYVSLGFIALTVSMFVSFLILRNSRKQKAAEYAEISGGLLESVELSNVSVSNKMPDISVDDLVGYFKGNPNQTNPDQGNKRNF